MIFAPIMYNHLSGPHGYFSWKNILRMKSHHNLQRSRVVDGNTSNLQKSCRRIFPDSSEISQMHNNWICLNLKMEDKWTVWKTNHMSYAKPLPQMFPVDTLSTLSWRSFPVARLLPQMFPLVTRNQWHHVVDKMRWGGTQKNTHTFSGSHHIQPLFHVHPFNSKLTGIPPATRVRKIKTYINTVHYRMMIWTSEVQANSENDAKQYKTWISENRKVIFAFVSIFTRHWFHHVSDMATDIRRP